jgi:hypothetical protein
MHWPVWFGAHPGGALTADRQGLLPRDAFFPRERGAYVYKQLTKNRR